MTSSYDEMMAQALRMARPSRLPWVLVILALVAGGASSVFLLRRVEAVRTEVEIAWAKTLRDEAQVRDELRRALGSNAEMEAKLRKAEQESLSLEQDNADILAENEQLTSSVQAKDEELAELKATAQELQDKMKAEIARGEIRLSQTNGRLKVDLVDKILFDSGDAQISKHGEEVLGRVGAILSRITDRQIQVAGHTDNAPISPRLAGRYATNWELSTSRATTVVRFLEEKARVPARRLAASGYAAFHPIASNATPAGRARNRRIEILLTPALDAAPAKLALAGAAPGKPTSEEVASLKPAATKNARKR